jgi:hypothetical protein
MLVFSNRFRPVAYLAIGALTLALGQSANAQGCRGGGSHGGGGGGMGYSRGGMGGGYMGGGGMGGSRMGGMGQSNGGMGGTGQSNGMTGGCQGQGPNSTRSQDSSASQPAVTSSTPASVNDPTTVLAHKDDLNLTTKQVQLLEKMLSTGKLHAAPILTAAQRKQLAQIISPVRKPGST